MTLSWSVEWSRLQGFAIEVFDFESGEIDMMKHADIQSHYTLMDAPLNTLGHQAACTDGTKVMPYSMLAKGIASYDYIIATCCC